MPKSEFFEQLQVFSDRFVAQEIGEKSSLSPWGKGSFKDESPIGAVLHFTADDDLLRVLRWFIKEKYVSKVSAHVVVADRKWGSHAEFAEGLPLIQELPVTVVQCRLPTTTAYHATWVNQLCYGVENLCAGELRQDETGSFTSWQRQDDDSPPWTMPWKSVIPGKTSPTPLYNRFWVPYPPEQVHANVIILREVHRLFPGSLKPSWIVGHECIDKRKPDPGPAFPIDDIREATFSEMSIKESPWFKRFSGLGGYYRMHENNARLEHWVKEFSRKPMPTNPDPSIIWKRFDSAVRTLPVEEDLDTFATGMTLLGYNGAGRSSLKIFQTMMGVHGERGVAGPKTAQALIERLEDRGILESKSVA